MRKARSLGTYDTRGGTPISPDYREQEPSPLEDNVLDLLEEAGLDTETNDKIMLIIQAAEGAKLAAEEKAADEAEAAATAERDTSYGTLPVGWGNHMGLSHEECACEGEDPNCPACHGTGKVPAR